MPRERQHPALASDILRSWLAMGAGVIALFAAPFAIVRLLPDEIGLDDLLQASLLIGWSIVCAVLIVLTLVVFAAARPPQLRTWLLDTRPPRRWFARFWWSLNGGGAIWWALTGAFVTLSSMLAMAVGSSAPAPLLLWSGIAVVALSVALIIVAFAVHYARIDATDGGFAFPGSADRRFGDYLYLAVQVSTTFGGSDVDLRTLRARRAVSMHSIIAWIYNTVVIALLVSVLIRGM
ncbi:MAG: DUF1345 domain-containing protein [Microbacterium sp.]